ncbi:Protein F36H2.3 e [Aphelenchoides avenae]|nr:Protein F36H2.3 e [Aphelenchus avenae]
MPLNGQVQYGGQFGSIGTYPNGATATLICNPGSTVYGTASSTCQNGQWYPPLGQCQGGGFGGGLGGIGGVGGGYGQCIAGMPPVLGGTIQYTQGGVFGPYPPGTTATLMCSNGAPSVGQNTATCQNGMWNPPSFVNGCNGGGFGGIGGGIGGIGGGIGGIGGGIGGIGGGQCGFGIAGVINGNVQYSQGGMFGPYPANTVATLVCNPGSVPAGQSAASCQNGQWNPPTLGPCNMNGVGGTGIGGLGGLGGGFGTASACYALPQPANGQLTYSMAPTGFGGSYPAGTTATVTCNIGFQPIGPTTSSCQATGWSSFSMGSCIQSIG